MCTDTSSMMATRTISLPVDAYKRLNRLKQKGESFTDVVQRLTGREDLSRFIGSISRGFADELDASLQRTRADMAREDPKRTKRIFGEHGL